MHHEIPNHLLLKVWLKGISIFHLSEKVVENLRVITYYSLERRSKRRKKGEAKTGIHLQILINQENQVVLSMITDGQKWHYLAVRKLSVLLKEVASNYKADSYCPNCLQSLRTKNKLNYHEKICKNHNYCEVVMPDDETKMLEYHQEQK